MSSIIANDDHIKNIDNNLINFVNNYENEKKQKKIFYNNLYYTGLGIGIGCFATIAYIVINDTTTPVKR
jgi:hypothetical protein